MIPDLCFLAERGLAVGVIEDDGVVGQWGEGGGRDGDGEQGGVWGFGKESLLFLGVLGDG